MLDSSAVLAILRNERGEEEAGRHLGQAAISAVNVSEVIQRLLADHGQAEARLAFAALGITTVAAGEADALEAARLHALPRTAGLSLGDRFCLALARRLDAPAVTADRGWSRVAAAVGVKVVQIRQ